MHAVGGLNDSIQDAAPHGKKAGEDGWGFRFEEMSANALVDAVERAQRLFHDGPAWTATVRRAMGLDYSWDRAAAQYEALYRGSA